MPGLEKHRQTYRQAVEALSDTSVTSLILVSRATRSTLA